MLDPNDLWVGDLIRLIRSGREGKFMGLTKDGRLRIALRDKVVLSTVKNAELLPEEKDSSALERLKSEAVEMKYSTKNLDSNIDLHIEKLNANLVNALPERIADYQIKAFEAYFEKAERQGLKFLTIIHGKGSGVLRAHIHSFLKTSASVRNYHLTNNDGATEVVLK